MYLKRCLVITWLVPCKTAAISVHILCTPCSHAHVYSVTSCKATYIGCMCVFSCNLPPALLAEQLGSSICYCGNMGVEWILKEESAQKIDHGEENYPTAPQTPWYFHHDSGTLPVSYSLSPDRGWWNEPTDTYTSYTWASKGFVCDNRRSWQNQHQLTDAHIYHSYRWVRTSAVSDNRSRHLQCVELFTDSQINYTADGMNWQTWCSYAQCTWVADYHHRWRNWERWGQQRPSWSGAVHCTDATGAAAATLRPPDAASLPWWRAITESVTKYNSPLSATLSLPCRLHTWLSLTKMHRVNLQNFNQIQHFHKVNITESWHLHLTVVQSMYICNKHSL